MKKKMTVHRKAVSEHQISKIKDNMNRLILRQLSNTY